MDPSTMKRHGRTWAAIAWAVALGGRLDPILGAPCDSDLPCGGGYVCDVTGECALWCSRGENVNGQCDVNVNNVNTDTRPICGCDTDAGCWGPLNGQDCLYGSICKSGELSDAGVTAGLCVRPDYTDKGDGTVTDNLTGLRWQQDYTFSQPLVCRSDGTGEGCNWTDAQTYCNELNLGGFTTGWRLPALLELFSLVELLPGGCLNSAAFPYMPDSSFWTSTPAGSGNAWLVSFQDGAVSSGAVSTVATVRCVR